MSKPLVLVTGGAGFIGSHLVDALIGQSYRVVVVDDLSSGKKSNINPKARFVRLDIRSSQIRSVFKRYRPRYVFHLAAQKNLRASIIDPVFDADVNILGSLNVFEEAARIKAQKIIFASTGGAMYGETNLLPTDELTPAQPESPYGIAKYTAERYLAFFQRSRRLPTISLRYANVFGPRQDPKGEAGVVAIFAERLRHGAPLRINGHGRQTRDYVYVSDVVKANLRAMKLREIGHEINIGTGVQTSVNELARLMQKISNQRTIIKHGPAIEGETIKSALSWKQAKKRLRWEPEVKLSAGLKMTWEWAKEEWPT